MKNRIVILKCTIIFLMLVNFLYAYDEINYYLIDTTKPKITLETLNPGGIFLSPGIGVEIPFLKFAGNSNMALSLGGRIEYSTLKLYPFVFAVSYYYQKHSGSDVYKTENLLNSLYTKVHNIGVGCDVILNKYLKQTFTIFYLTVELKYLSIKREISPETVHLDLKKEDSVFGISGGLGFTLYIFDIYGTYNYAKEYSSFSVKTRFRLPLLRF
ncbi:MAG: hypothetical protein N2490_07870 [Ignavibacteria bacterium]|nr:hypothetical protein [Ignavibacteria bacterium]